MCSEAIKRSVLYLKISSTFIPVYKNSVKRITVFLSPINKHKVIPLSGFGADVMVNI